MRYTILGQSVSALMTFLAVVTFDSTSYGEPAKPEEGYIVRTVDGLDLWAKWFEGGLGEKSDTVILVHSYGSQTSKGQWEDLARGLQKEGLSVLMFDLRGHGKSAENQAINDWKEFCSCRYNKLAVPNSNLNPNYKQEIKASNFKSAYYPYLTNDLESARRFLDKKNDEQKCNSGRVFIIAEGSIAPLVMLGVSVEFHRFGLGPAVVGGIPPEHPAGRDYAGILFLSASNGTSNIGASSALTFMQNSLWNKPGAIQDKLPLAKRLTIYDRIREHVSMLFLYGKEDREAAIAARGWLTKFKVPESKTADTVTRKFMVELSVEKLSGIKMMDVLVEEKVKQSVNGVEEYVTIKVPLMQQHIVRFIKDSVANGKSGGAHQKRNIENFTWIPVPFDKWGLALPK